MSLVWYDLEKLRKYPHMLARDVALWERFIDRHPDYYQEVAYDVKVGKGVELPPDYPGNIKTDALALTRKRIDVVGIRPEGVDVIEVKPLAGLSAIGQVVSYRILFELEQGDGRAIRAVILTDRKDPDYDILCGVLGIKVILI